MRALATEPSSNPVVWLPSWSRMGNRSATAETNGGFAFHHF
jgi:hypothetical protein